MEFGGRTWRENAGAGFLDFAGTYTEFLFERSVVSAWKAHFKDLSHKFGVREKLG